MSESVNHVEATESLSRTLAKYYFVGLSWSLASLAIVTRDLSLPSIALGSSFTIHIDHLVIIGAVFVAIVFPMIFALVEVSEGG